MLKALNDSSRPKLQFLLIAAIILILSFICYGPALNADLNWDDGQWLTDNEAVKHSNISWIWQAHRSTASYYPLTITSFWLEYRIWGQWTPGYRLVNILLHAASAAMLWKILQKIKVPGAFFAAIIWAIHPLQVETVVWIAERKNTLSGVFFFAGLLAWMRFIAPDAGKREKMIAYAATFILLVCALFSKGSTVFFPVAALGLGWLTLGKLRLREILFSIPLFAVALTMALVTMHFEYYYASAAYGPEWQLSVPQRIILAGRCFWFYIEKLFWPNPLSFVYTRWELHANEPLEYLGFIAAIALFAFVGWLAWKKKILSPFIAITLYLAAIFPVIGFFKFFTQLFTYVADHYSYLANAASIALVVGILFSGWHYIKTYLERFKLPQWLAPITCLSLILACITISCGQSLLYRSYLASWEETLRITPGAWIAQVAIGNYKLNTLNQPTEALGHFLEGLKGRRDTRLLANLGVLYERFGQHETARAYYQEAIDKHVRASTAYIRQALYEMADGNPKKAIEYCNKGLEFNEFDATLWAVTGSAYHMDKQLENAAAAYIKCLELQPDARNIHYVLGDIAFELGKYPEAINLYMQARDKDPDNQLIRFDLAKALKKIGHEQEAQAEEAEGIRLRAVQGTTTKPEILGIKLNKKRGSSSSQPAQSQPAH